MLLWHFAVLGAKKKNPPCKALLHPHLLPLWCPLKPLSRVCFTRNTIRPCAFFPWTLPKASPLTCLPGAGDFPRRLFKCSLMGQGGATFAAAPFLSLCRGSLMSANSLLPLDSWGSLPHFAARWEKGEGLQALVNCQMSICERKGTWTCLPQPFWMPPPPLTLTWAGQGRKSEEACFLHILLLQNRPHWILVL